MKNKKMIFNFLFLVIFIGLILYFSLKDNFQEVMTEVMKLNPIFFVLAIVVLLLSRYFIGLSLHAIVRSNDYKYSKLSAFKLVLITQFFNGITPFSTGGQPAEVYYLKREKIPLLASTNIILQNFIVYQVVLIFLGLGAIAYNKIFNIFPENNILKNLVIIGFIINVGVCIILFLVSFGKKFNSFVLNKGINLLHKIHIIKDIDKTREKLNNYTENFYKNAKVLLKNKKLIFKTVLYNIIAVLLLYSIPYIIVCGMGDYTSINLLEAISASAYVMLMGAFIPTPGASGGIEYGFIGFFGYFLNNTVVTAVMLLWRVVTYYIAMIIGGITMLFYKKGDNE